MADTGSTFRFSQDVELLIPQKRKAYPISISEWKFLKDKIGKIKDFANIFHTMGSVFLGIFGSAILSILTYEKPNPITLDYTIRAVITIGIIVVTVVCGVVLMIFGFKQRQTQNVSPREILSQMELIEGRYDPKPADHVAEKSGADSPAG